MARYFELDEYSRFNALIKLKHNTDLKGQHPFSFYLRKMLNSYLPFNMTENSGNTRLINCTRLMQDQRRTQNPVEHLHGAYLQKKLKTFRRSLFLQKSPIVDVRLSSKYASEVIDKTLKSLHHWSNKKFPKFTLIPSYDIN